MKDVEIAVIVAGLAGLAFLMTKSQTDRPAENMRDFYRDPAPIREERLDPEGKKILYPPAYPDRVYEVEEELEREFMAGEKGYAAYRASLSHAIGEVQNWQSEDPLREGLRKHLNELSRWAQDLRTQVVKLINSWTREVRAQQGSAAQSPYRRQQYILERDLQTMQQLLSENHDRWLDRTDKEVPDQILQQFFQLNTNRKALYYEDRRAFNTVEMDTDTPPERGSVNFISGGRQPAITGGGFNPVFRTGEFNPTDTPWQVHRGAATAAGVLQTESGRRAYKPDDLVGALNSADLVEATEQARKDVADQWEPSRNQQGEYFLANARNVAVEQGLETNLDTDVPTAPDNSGEAGFATSGLPKPSLAQQQENAAKRTESKPKTNANVKPPPDDRSEDPPTLTEPAQPFNAARPTPKVSVKGKQRPVDTPDDPNTERERCL